MSSAPKPPIEVPPMATRRGSACSRRNAVGMASSTTYICAQRPLRRSWKKLLPPPLGSRIAGARGPSRARAANSRPLSRRSGEPPRQCSSTSSGRPREPPRGTTSACSSVRPT